jgi:hypothetical protein
MFGHLAFSCHLRVRFRRPSPLSDERVKFYDIFLPSSSSSSSSFVVSPARESRQPRPSYESKTRRENARPLTRSANFTDVRSIRFNARRLFLPSLNSESREIDAIPRNFLPGDRRTDARSTSSSERNARRSIFLAPLLRFGRITTNLAKTRPAPSFAVASSRWRIGISEICEIAAPVGRRVQRRPFAVRIKSIRSVEGRRQRRDAGRNAAEPAFLLGGGRVAR